MVGMPSIWELEKAIACLKWLLPMKKALDEKCLIKSLHVAQVMSQNVLPIPKKRENF